MTTRRHARRQRTLAQDGPHPVDLYVGKRLREARLLAGFKQRDLAQAIGVSFQAVQKYETGDNRISASRLLQAAQFLGCPISYFFHDLESGAPPQAPKLVRNEIELIRHYRYADEQARGVVANLIKSMSSIKSK